MNHTVACPSCQRTLRVPDSLLGQQVKCPSCMHTFFAPETLEEVPRPAPSPPREPSLPRPTATEEEFDEPRSIRSGPEKPGKVLAIGIMVLIGGILALLFAAVWVISVIGLCWPGTYYALVLGILAIIKGMQLLGDKAYRETPPSTIGILMIINIINADVVNLTLGILVLVFLGDREVKDYFRH
jgi:predicted Zn finger-like uncharacterized protein